MRAFLAADVSKQLKKSAIRIKSELSQYNRFLRFVSVENLHITIKFFGRDIDTLEVRSILNVVNKMVESYHSFNFKLDSPRYGFDNRRWPRVLFIPVVRNSYYNKFVAELSDELIDINTKFRINTDNRPHITIARTKRRLNNEVVSGVQTRLDELDIVEGIRVSRIKLVNSRLTKAGPIYKNIGSFNLGS